MKLTQILALVVGVSIFGQAAAQDVIRVALLSSTAHSALYKWNDTEGRIHYSDKPPVGIARDYEPDSQAKGMVTQLEHPKSPSQKPVAEYLPSPLPPQSAVNKIGQKPSKINLAENLVWLDRSVR